LSSIDFIKLTIKLMLQIFCVNKRSTCRQKNDYFWHECEHGATLYIVSGERKMKARETPMRPHNATLILSTRDLYAKLRNAHGKTGLTASKPTVFDPELR